MTICMMCQNPAEDENGNSHLCAPVMVSKLVTEIATELGSAMAKYPDCVYLPDCNDNPQARRNAETIARLTCDRAYREGRLTHAQVFEEEVCEALTKAAEGDTTDLRKELIQCIAMAVKWIHDIDGRAERFMIQRTDPIGDKIRRLDRLTDEASRIIQSLTGIAASAIRESMPPTPPVPPATP